jgi:hypothetical protein
MRAEFLFGNVKQRWWILVSVLWTPGEALIKRRAIGTFIFKSKQLIARNRAVFQ